MLFVLPDLDAPTTKGYQVRSLAIASGLGPRYSTRVVSARRSRVDEHLGADGRPLDRARTLLTNAMRGRPLQTALFDGPDVARRVRDMAERWQAEAVVVVTERMPESVEALRDRHVVVDVVDSQRVHMRARAERSRLLRPVWRREELAFADVARRLRACAGAVVAASDSALAEYPDAVVIPNAARASTAPRPDPSIDAVFTGTLSYWPNAEAVLELCRHIAPRIRASLPHSRIVVAGRRPSAELRRACEAARVDLRADVPDIDAVLRDSRLALAPLRWTPAANLKVMEALVAGTPVLAYPEVVQHLPAPRDGVIECRGPREMADVAVQVLTGARAPAPPSRHVHTWTARAAEFALVLDGLFGSQRLGPRA